MTRINCFLLLILLTLTVGYSQPKKGNIAVEASGFENNEGVARIIIYNAKNASAFPKDDTKCVDNKKVKISSGKASVVFSGLPYDEYAIAVLHDENNNGKMDRNWIGMPSEGYGFSNDATGTFGPPKFEKASFKLDKENQIIKINMVN